MSFFSKKNFNLNYIKQTASSIKDKTIELSEKATDTAKNAYETTSEKMGKTYAYAKESLQEFDYDQLKRKEFYIQKGKEYSELSIDKVSSYFKSTFEVDKSTMEMVDDARKRLPVPAKDIDDIFEQCKRQTIQRAISVFALSGLFEKVDDHSAEKYSKLSQDYNEWYQENAYALNGGNENFANMQNIRSEAGVIGTLEDGYNKSNILYASDADIEHVIAKKELFDDILLQIGTTDNELTDVIGAKENLIFTDVSFNRSLQDQDIFKYLEKKLEKKRGVVDVDNPDLIHVQIGDKTRTVNIKDIEEAFAEADASRQASRLTAVQEVGKTVALTGAVMAAQQVVGLIIVETIDIFTDEIKNTLEKGKIVNADGWIQNVQDATERVRQKLSDRFEERQIWQRAKDAGIEAGVAGALSVIPQILISMILKTPSFVLALIRESTLSIIRCIRILASKDENKLKNIQVILAGAASAIVALYIGRAISSAIASVPLLNRFNRQITDILSGMFITAIILSAIYIFEKNKSKLSFVTSKLNLPKNT